MKEEEEKIIEEVTDRLCPSVWPQGRWDLDSLEGVREFARQCVEAGFLWGRDHKVNQANAKHYEGHA